MDESALIAQVAATLLAGGWYDPAVTGGDQKTSMRRAVDAARSIVELAREKGKAK
jgi:hypothetical protein